MKIPHEIKIGGDNYSVSYKNFPSKDFMGNIHYGEKTIQIEENLTKKDKKTCFFHEVAHGILREMEYNYPKIAIFADNETFCKELGLILNQIFNKINEPEQKGPF